MPKRFEKLKTQTHMLIKFCGFYYWLLKVQMSSYRSPYKMITGVVEHEDDLSVKFENHLRMRFEDPGPIFEILRVKFEILRTKCENLRIKFENLGVKFENLRWSLG